MQKETGIVQFREPGLYLLIQKVQAVHLVCIELISFLRYNVHSEEMMSLLPIKHMTLYKHGVGFFRRRGEVDGESLKLTFRREEMDDLLKSLTVIDHAGGQVRGVDYDTPQSREERLKGCSVILNDKRSLRDLLMALRGRKVKLNFLDGNHIQGILLGPDETEEKPLKRYLVSILEDGTSTTSVIQLERLEGVEIKDQDAAEDLRFFLHTSSGRETHRAITIRLEPGLHDLEVAYIAPAPGWRVSYRLVIEEEIALLQGWGIFDNRLDEDLNEISLSLTAGMPISFIYDLYTPHTPERPVVKEENRVVAGPVMFGAAVEEAMPAEADIEMVRSAAAGRSAPMRAMRSAPADDATRGGISMDMLSDSIPAAASGKELGELFQYNVSVPVTVGRGQSAMAPIISDRLKVKKELIYNRLKMETHPVAALRFDNSTGLTLERGPVTVLDEGQYVGEAVLPFTSSGSETVISFAIELGVHIKEEEKYETQLHGLNIKDHFLIHQSYDIRQTCYSIDNRSPETKTILLERPRDKRFETFDTIEPSEKTLETVRYKVEAPAGKLTEFISKERRLRVHKQELKDLSYSGLNYYFKDKFLDQKTYKDLKTLLDVLAEIGDLKASIAKEEKTRERIYKSQEQIRSQLAVLAKDGEEGRLRGRYVMQLSRQEEELAAAAKKIAETTATIETREKAVAGIIQGLNTSD